MRRVEKGADGSKVGAEILRAQALTYLRGKHGAKDLEKKGVPKPLSGASLSLTPTLPPTPTWIPTPTLAQLTHPNSPASPYFMLPPNEEAADHCSAAFAYAALA